MADNLTLNAGSGGADLATDEIASVHYQKILVGFGADGTWTRVAAGVGFPVELQAGTAAFGKLAANDGVDIGDVTVNNAADGGAYVRPGTSAIWQVQSNSANVATETTLGALNGKVIACDTESVIVDTMPGMAAEAAALPAFFLVIAGDDGTDTQPIQLSSTGDLKVTLDSESVTVTGTVTAKLATDTIQNGTTALTPKFAKISCASSGDNAVVAAVADKKIRVLAIALIATGAVAIYLNDGTADLFADATNKVPLDETGATGAGGFILPFNPVGWFETAAVNRAFNVNLSAAVGVCGSLVYVEV